MKVTLSAGAKKQFLRLNEPIFSRIAAGIDKLKKEPPEGDIKKLQGQDGFRLRIGDYRIIYKIKGNRIAVHKIVPRGGAYKR